MAIGAISDSHTADRHADSGRLHGIARLGVIALVALCAAAALWFVLPSAAFRTRALVAVTDIASPLSSVLPRAAADAAVSEPVMLRAAQSLIGTNVPVPAPDVMEQIAVVLGLGGAHATGQEARLAADLASAVTAKPGDVPGSVEVSARLPDAARAAQVATAVAEALVADQDDMIAQARRKRDIDAIALVERLNAQATAARRRLAALGGAEADPAQIRAAAAAQTATAQARVDIIHAIIASGAPPLSDRRDVPSGIETLQGTYLDVTRQLAKARETLGDRHTTVISLQNEVKHAAASLTAEWRRLAHLAEAELGTARQREAMLRTTDTAADATRRDAIQEARRSVQVADDNITRAQGEQRETPIDERTYRLMARAPLPTTASGFSVVSRVLVAGGLGLFVFWIGLRLPRFGDAAALMSRSRADGGERFDPTAVDQPVVDAEAADAALRRAMKRREKFMRNSRDAEPAFGAEEALLHSMSELLPGLQSITPEFGAVATVMVAANEMAAGTTPAALALGRAAVDAGYRVLIVEVARTRAELAMAADPDADPVLIDLFGVLRVALPAAATDGFLYLAPSFEHGARIASALARQSATPLIDDFAAEFDLIVIDGGRAADSAAAGWGADAFVRIGRFAAERDDHHFAATFGVAASALLGTIVASAFAPKPQRKPVRPMSGLGASNADAASVGALGPRPAPKPQSHGHAAPPTRATPMVARRRTGPRLGASARY